VKKLSTNFWFGLFFCVLVYGGLSAHATENTPAQPRVKTAQSQVKTSEDAGFYKLSGDHHFKGMEYIKAVDDYEKYLALTKRADPDVTYRSGVCYQRMGIPDLATKAFQTASELYGNSMKGYFARCDCYMMKSDFDQALREALEACRLFPNEWRTYARLGFCFHKICQYREAIAPYSKALEVHGKISDKQTLFEEFWGRPHDTRIVALRAQCYYKVGKFKECEADCTRVIGLRPDFFPGYEARGEARLQMGDFVGASKDFETAIKLARARPAGQFGQGTIRARTFKQLAFCQQKLGLNTLACANLNEAIKMFPKYVDAYKLRSDVMKKLGNDQAAEIDAKMAEKLGLRPLLPSEQY